MSDERLARLLEEHLGVGIAILSAREERQREVVAAEAAERAERERAEGEEALRDMEAAERARAEVELPRLPAATVVAGMERAAFLASAYMPPTPLLFVPSGFAAHRPRRIDYDAELVLRDPEVHISRTWIKVYLRNSSFCT